MSAYRKGYRAERGLMRFLEKQDYRCIRSAGSHTPVDLIAGNGVHVYVVQVKYGKTRQNVDLDELREWAGAFNAVPCVATRRPYGGWVVEEVGK